MKTRLKVLFRLRFGKRRNMGTHSDMFANASWRDYETLPQLLEAPVSVNKAPGLQMERTLTAAHMNTNGSSKFVNQSCSRAGSKARQQKQPTLLHDHSQKLLAVPRSHRRRRPTLHPNSNDKELFVQATLQWHNNGVH